MDLPKGNSNQKYSGLNDGAKVQDFFKSQSSRFVRATGPKGASWSLNQCCLNGDEERD